MDIGNIITLIISGIIAFGTSFVMIRLTYKSDIKKSLFENRLKIYSESFYLLERLLNKANLIYTDTFYREIIEIKAKLKLIASNNVITSYAEIYTACATRYINYTSFKRTISQNDSVVFKKQCEDYILRHNFDRTELSEMIGRLVDSMRVDLGQDY